MEVGRTFGVLIIAMCDEFKMRRDDDTFTFDYSKMKTWKEKGAFYLFVIVCNIFAFAIV